MNRLAFAILPLLCLLAAGPCFAETPVGSEFQINTTATGNQLRPDIALQATGEFVVVWESDHAGDLDIMARRYGAGGSPIGSEFTIASTADPEDRAAIAMFPDGSFVVAWEVDVSVGLDQVWFRIFDSSGSPRIAAQQLEADISAVEFTPAVAVAADGDFVIVVEAGSEIYAQRYASTGSAIGAPILVNTYLTGLQNQPDVAFQSDKDFIVTWSSLGQDGDGYGVYCRRFNWSGAGAVEIQVNSYTTGAQNSSEIDVRSDDGYIITWESFGQDGSGDGIYAQSFSSSDAKIGVEWRVNTYTSSNQTLPDLCINDADEFTIVWQSANQDGSFGSVYAQDFTSGASFLGAEYKVNSYASSFQGVPRVAVGGTHQVAVWYSDGQDGSGYGVFGQRFSAPAPDLTVTSVVVPSEFIDASDPLDFSVTVLNSGIACGPFSVQMKFSYNNVISTADPTLVTIPFTGLAEGAIHFEFVSLPIPAGMPKGSIYLGAIADVYGEIAESNESNNTSFTPFDYHVPEIWSLADVSGDQGGALWLEWYPSPLDVAPAGTISEYTVWRTLELNGLPRMDTGSIPTLDEVLARSDGGSVSTLFEQTPILRDANTTTFWELVGTQPAYFLEGYAMEVPTLFDSTAVNTGLHYVRVIAHQAGIPYPYYISTIASARSTDDLAPGTPMNLAGDVRTGPGIDLSWDANQEEDLAGYHVHRGDSPGFAPTEENRIGTPSTNAFNDPEWSWGGNWHYRVAATDVHGNVSGFADLAPETVTAVDAPAMVVALGQNYPNPFNPRTRIDYSIDTSRRVRIAVFDAAGRHVRTLVDGVMKPGDYSVEWDGCDALGHRVATGVFYCRMTAGAFLKTVKMTMVK